MHIRAAERLGADDFTGGGFHQRRPRQKNRALIFDDDGFVAHRGHVRAARGTRTHHARDLRNALGGHARLIVKNTSEVFAVGKHLILTRQMCAAGIDQVNARQVIFARDLLRA